MLSETSASNTAAIRTCRSSISKSGSGSPPPPDERPVIYPGPTLIDNRIRRHTSTAEKVRAHATAGNPHAPAGAARIRNNDGSATAEHRRTYRWAGTAGTPYTDHCFGAMSSVFFFCRCFHHARNSSTASERSSEL